MQNMFIYIYNELLQYLKNVSNQNFHKIIDFHKIKIHRIIFLYINQYSQ